MGKILTTFFILNKINFEDALKKIQFQRGEGWVGVGTEGLRTDIPPLVY